MKKIIILSVLIVMSFSLRAQQPQPKERMYVFYVPEKYMNIFNAVIYGQSDAMSVGNYKAIISIYETQLQRQQQAFHVQDSLAKAGVKPKAADSIVGIKPAPKKKFVNVKKQ